MSNSAVDMYGNLSDEELICKIRQSDEKAYSELLKRYSHIINRIVSKYSTSTDNDDIYQEANISFYYASMFYDFQSSSFATFSAVCIERGVLAVLKKSQAKKRIPLNLIVPLDDEVLDSGVNPEELLFEREGERIMLKEIEDRLSKKELSVLKSYLTTGSYELTARELSLPKKSVDNALLRVRKKLDSLR